MNDAHALHSLYGGGRKRRALAGNVGAADREQTVLTPPWFIAGLTRTVGAPLTLDPCTTPDNPLGAEVFCTEQTDGLAQDWSLVCTGPERWAYVNPPFNALEAWLRALNTQRVPAYALIPFRPHRRWFGELIGERPIVPLWYAFRFVGHKDAFPAPLCLVCYDVPPPASIQNERGQEMVLGVLTFRRAA